MAIEENVKKYVDLVLALREVVDELKGVGSIPFWEAVAKEMRGRGMSEVKIAGFLRGASWRRENWAAILKGMKESPSILDGENRSVEELIPKETLCWHCKYHQKDIFHTTPGGDYLYAHYCSATTKPYDVIDPDCERKCDYFEEQPVGESS